MENLATHDLNLATIITFGLDRSSKYTSTLQRPRAHSAATCGECHRVGRARRVRSTTAPQMEDVARSLRHQSAGICSTDRTAMTTHTGQHTARCWVPDQRTTPLRQQKTKQAEGPSQPQHIRRPKERPSCASSCQPGSSETFRLQSASPRLWSPGLVRPEHSLKATVSSQSRTRPTRQNNRWRQTEADQSYIVHKIHIKRSSLTKSKPANIYRNTLCKQEINILKPQITLVAIT